MLRAFSVLAASAFCLACWSSGCGRMQERSFDATAPRDDAGRPPGSLAPNEGGARLTACDEARLRGAPLACSYLVFPVPDGSSSNEGCTAVFVSNPGASAARIEVLRGGKPLDIGGAARLVSMTLASSPGYVTLERDELPPQSSAVIALVQGALARFPVTSRSVSVLFLRSSTRAIGARTTSPTRWRSR